MIRRRIRFFIIGLAEYRATVPLSGAHDWRLLDAYFAGRRFAWRLRRGRQNVAVAALRSLVLLILAAAIAAALILIGGHLS